MALTFDQWLDLAKVAFVIIASVIAFGKFLERVDKPQTQEQGTQDHRDSTTLIVALDKRVEAIEWRMDRAGLEMSKLASYVQGGEMRARELFVDKNVCQSNMHESESDRKLLRSELDRLRRTEDHQQGRL